MSPSHRYLVATDINEQGVQSVVESIRAQGGEAIAVKHDVTSRSSWEDVFAEVEATCGKLDILVNISSISALTGMAGAGAYTGSKSAVRSLTKAAAVDYGKQNIRVNSVHPGYIVTTMSAPHMEHSDFLNQIALPNLGQADEVAAVVLFLASDEANHISGIELPVDGGVTAK